LDHDRTKVGFQGRAAQARTAFHHAAGGFDDLTGTPNGRKIAHNTLIYKDSAQLRGFGLRTPCWSG